MQVILAALDSPLSLKTRAAARLLLTNYRDHRHAQVCYLRV
jgi:hypothetical protein